MNEAQKLGEQIKRELLDACINASHETYGLKESEVAFDTAVDRLVALAHREPVGEELTEGYVQPVPDKCDRITWRGRYYGLPITPSTSASEPASIVKAVKAINRVMVAEPAPHQLMIGDVVRQCAYPGRGQYKITGMHGVNDCWITVEHPYGPFRAHELERVFPDPIQTMRSMGFSFALDKSLMTRADSMASSLRGSRTNYTVEQAAANLIWEMRDALSAQQLTAQEQKAVQQGPIVDMEELKRALMAIKPTIADADGHLCIRRESALNIIDQRITSATPSAQQVEGDWVDAETGEQRVTPRPAPLKRPPPFAAQQTKETK